MNRHWSVFTHLVTDQKTKIIQLRRSRLSKRRILLRIYRSTLLDKRIIQLNVSNDWIHFTLISINSSRCYAARAKNNSSSRFTKSDWTFSKQTILLSQSNSLLTIKLISEEMSTEISINSYLSDLDSSNKDELDFITCKVDKNIFVQTTIISYDRENLKDDTLWEQFREDFVDWIKDDFKSEVLNIRLRRLRNVLQKRDV
jgi:hypothetical protein